MNESIKRHWWKWLGSLLFLYVLIGGLTVPLKPGIVDVSKLELSTGLNEVVITGYNTHFTAGQNQIWIKADQDHFLESTSNVVLNDNQIKAKFAIPSHLDIEGKMINLTLIIQNVIDGPAILPSAFYYKNEGASNGESMGWAKIDDLSFNQASGIRFPYRSILNETIRNTFFHVALWMAMFGLLIAGIYHSIRYLITRNADHDKKSYAFHIAAIIYGLLGLATGSLWARFTWDTWWTQDIKLNMAAISMLIYLAYLILRSSIMDFDKRARVSAVYSIFAMVAIIPLIIILPRINDSLHPGNGGNPALGGEDLDNTLRMFFYPSIIALIMIGSWIAQLTYRYEKIKEKVFTDL